MKSHLTTFCVLLTASLSLAAPATTLENSPVTGEDVAKVLDLHPDNYHILKERIRFDSPQHAILRCFRGSGYSDYEIPGGATSTVTVMTYVASDGGPVKELRIWGIGDHGSTSRGFAIDSTKTKVTEAKLINGIFTIRSAASDRDLENGAEYRIEVLVAP